jgi:DNA-binding YbaB/EbfC family protein
MNINPLDLIKSAQEMQERLADIQEKLDEVKEIGAAGGDMVEVLINGRMEIISISITPELLNLEDRGVLQSLIVAACNNGIEKIKERIGLEAGGVFGGGLTGLAPFLRT